MIRCSAACWPGRPSFKRKPCRICGCSSGSHTGWNGVQIPLHLLLRWPVSRAKHCQVHRASSQKAQACLWSSGSREIATTKWVECFQSIFRLSNFSNFGLRAKASSTNSASHFRACSELRRHRRARRARNSRSTPSGLSRSNLDQARLETPSPVPHYKFRGRHLFASECKQ